jgi:uncharacterized membrane protein
MTGLYVLAGLNHFRIPNFYRPMMPPWIPFQDPMIYVSGAIEVLLGLFLLWPTTRPLAAWGIIAMLLAFFSVHIYMFQERATVFQDVPTWLIAARLPFQFVLIYWAFVYTRDLSL